MIGVIPVYCFFLMRKKLFYFKKKIGPDARPSNEELIETTTDQSESSTNTTLPGRGVQNFLMQRMSDILTQLVSRTTSETEDTEATTTSNNAQTNPNVPQTNDYHTPSSPIINTPLITTPSSPSPPSTQNLTSSIAINERNNTNAAEDSQESNVSYTIQKKSFLILFFLLVASWYS